MKRGQIFLCIALFVSASFLRAQEVQKFTGQVADSGGAVVPKASVIARNLDTGVTTPTTTTSSGNYTIPFVIPGHYSVTVRASGFETAIRTGLTLEVDQVATVNFTLKVGAVTETVTVNADALLDSSKADNGEVVEHTRVTELPLNGGDPGMLAILAPGTVWTGSLASQRPFDDTQASLSVNGGGTGNVALMLDGAPNNASPINYQGAANISYVPPIDSVQEFKIVTNPYDAQYGLMAGAVEDVTLKSGTNRLHGSVYEFARRTWLNANTWQNDYAIATATPGTNTSQFNRAPSKWDQYGVEVNGPVFIPKVYDGRNKSFFAVGYENFHEIEPNTIVTSVPSPQWINGDFSNLVYWNGSSYSPIALYDPLTIAYDPATQNWNRQLFGPNDTINPGPANVIPASRINPVAQAILKLYPAPNTTPPGGTNPFANNYITIGPDVNEYRNLLAKWDQNFSDKDRASLSYGYWERVETKNTNGIVGPPAQGYLPLGNRSHTFVVKETHTFTPQLLFDFRASVNVRADYWFGGPPYSPSALTTWSPALIAAMGSAAATVFPDINFSEFAGMGTEGNTQKAKNSLSMVPAVTWIKNKHSIHGGFDARLWQDGYNIVNGGNNWWVDRTWTQKNCGSCGSWEQQDGNSIASFLLGNPTSGGDQINSTAFYSAHYFAPFVQDDWKVSPRLTLNLGVRWDFIPAETERHNRGMYAFDSKDVNPISSQVSVPGFGQLLGGPTYLGVNGNPRQDYPLTKTNIQPRVGAAYVLNSKTVLRAGFGESMRPPQNGPDTAGYSQYTSYQANDPNYPGQVYPNLANQINNPYSSILQPTGSSLGMETQLGQGPSAVYPYYKTPSFWNYSAGFERQLSNQDVVNASYVGTRLYNGDSSDDFNHESASAILALKCNPNTGGQWENCNNYNVLNPFQGNSLFNGSNYYSPSTISGLNLTRPYPQFSDMTMYELNGDRTWYNSLQIDGLHRLHNGLVLHVNWTWSKLMDAGGYADTTFRVPSRGIDGNDRTHIVNVSGVYYLPVGWGRTFLGNLNRFADVVIGGWEISGLYKLQSGAPLSLNMYEIHPSHVKPYIQKSDGYIRLIAPCVQQWNDTNGTYNMQQLQYDYGGQSYAQSCPAGPNFQTIQSWEPGQNGIYLGRQPRYQQFDTNLSKNYILGAGMKLTVRLDAFNTLNHPVWSEGPDTNQQDSTFGVIARGVWGQSNLPRELQISGKLSW